MIKSGIYKIYWKNNPYYYYGQAVDLNRRKSSHIESIRKNKHKNPKMQSVYNKYGDFVFMPIVLCETKHLDFLEQRYLDEHFGNDFCCNLCPKSFSSKGRVYSDKGLKAIQEAAKNRQSVSGENNPFFGKTHTEETKRKISESRKGKRYPNLSLAMKGRIASNETKQKLSKARKYGGAPKAKTILDTNTGVFYSCAKEVSDLYGYTTSTFRAKMNGRLKNNTQFVQL